MKHTKSQLVVLMVVESSAQNTREIWSNNGWKDSLVCYQGLKEGEEHHTVWITLRTTRELSTKLSRSFVDSCTINMTLLVFRGEYEEG